MEAVFPEDVLVPRDVILSPALSAAAKDMVPACFAMVRGHESTKYELNSQACARWCKHGMREVTVANSVDLASFLRSQLGSAAGGKVPTIHGSDCQSFLSAASEMI